MPRLETTVNGEKLILQVDGLRPLADVLRDELGLFGTKIGCREGECGACSVLLEGEAVNACLLPAMKAHGRTVVTIEGLGTMDEPHPLQTALAEAGGVQCGFCTPGLVVAAAGLLSRTPTPTTSEILEAIEGNLCRCTGYARVLQGIAVAAAASHSGTRRP